MSSAVPTVLVFASLGSAALGWIMFLLSVFLILLVLVQRGKGGGLTGALGGPGGQSAFGSKAGDTFTLITAVSAIIWGFVCAVAMYTLGVPPTTASDEEFDFEDAPAAISPMGDESTSGAGSLDDLSGLLEDLKEGSSDEKSTEGTPSMELTPANADDAETQEGDEDKPSEEDSDEGKSE